MQSRYHYCFDYLAKFFALYASTIFFPALASMCLDAHGYTTGSEDAIEVTIPILSFKKRAEDS